MNAKAPGLYDLLTDAARRHLLDKGCPGDICGRCKGQGFVRVPHERDFGVTVSERCGVCMGSGMRS